MKSLGTPSALDHVQAQVESSHRIHGDAWYYVISHENFDLLNDYWVH